MLSLFAAEFDAILSSSHNGCYMSISQTILAVEWSRWFSLSDHDSGSLPVHSLLALPGSLTAGRGVKPQPWSAEEGAEQLHLDDLFSTECVCDFGKGVGCLVLSPRTMLGTGTRLRRFQVTLSSSAAVLQGSNHRPVVNTFHIRVPSVVRMKLSLSLDVWGMLVLCLSRTIKMPKEGIKSALPTSRYQPLNTSHHHLFTLLLQRSNPISSCIIFDEMNFFKALQVT